MQKMSSCNEKEEEHWRDTQQCSTSLIKHAAIPCRREGMLFSAVAGTRSVINASPSKMSQPLAWRRTSAGLWRFDRDDDFSAWKAIMKLLYRMELLPRHNTWSFSANCEADDLRAWRSPSFGPVKAPRQRSAGLIRDPLWSHFIIVLVLWEQKWAKIFLSQHRDTDVIPATQTETKAGL